MHYVREHMAVLLLMATLLTGALAGCGRDEEPTPSAPPKPTPQPPTPVAVAPAAQTPTQPAAQSTNAAAAAAAAAPLPAVFVINDRAFEFPPSKLVFERVDGKMRATLFSIDPPAAVKERDAGNSFYFNFDLDIASLDELAGQRVEYGNSAGVDRDDDATTGIFISGGTQVLQPVQAAVEFPVTETGEMLVLVGGTFSMRDDRTPDASPMQVTVRARLTPVVREQNR